MVDNTDIVPSLFRPVRQDCGGREYRCQLCGARIDAVDGESLRRVAMDHLQDIEIYAQHQEAQS